MSAPHGVQVPFATVLLGLLNATILIVMGWLLLHRSDAELLDPEPRKARSVSMDINVRTRPTDFAFIQSQPIFHQSRTFFVEPETLALAPPPDYRLSGSIAIPNKPLFALLIHNQTNARIKIAAGEELEGWRVEDIAPKRVIIKQGSRIFEILSTSRQSATDNPAASTSNANGRGMTIVGQPQQARQTPAVGLRVLGATQSSSSRAPRSAGETGTTRLYRPPPP